LQGREKYERALAAAQLQSVQLLSGGGDDQVRAPPALLLSLVHSFINGVFLIYEQGIDYDDGNDIAEALARARQAVLKTHKGERDNEFEVRLLQKDDEEQHTSADCVVFTETTEFVTSVRGIHQKMADAAGTLFMTSLIQTWSYQARCVV
jgi:hypothetical protein